MNALMEPARIDVLEPETQQRRSSDFGVTIDFEAQSAECGMTAADYRVVFDRAVERIESAYGLKVKLGPVTGSYTGQFDGLEIWVDPEKDPEEALFILVHLFGHTV